MLTTPNLIVICSALLVLTLCVSAGRVILRRPPRHRPTAEDAASYTGVRRLYLLFAIGFTLFAFYGSALSPRFQSVPFADAVQQFKQLPLIPEYVSRTDVATNVLFMIPVSFFWLAALLVNRKSQLLQLIAVALVFTCCVLLALSNEFVQLWTDTRVPSKLDVMAQAVGSSIGILLWQTLGTAVTEWLRSYSVADRPDRRLIWLLEAYLIGLVIYSMMPLDLTISVSDLGHKLLNGQIEWRPFQYYPLHFDRTLDVLRNIVVFIPIGMFAAVWHTGRDHPVRSWPDASSLGVLIVLAIELAQLFVQSRFTSITDVLFGSIGVIAGVAIMRVWWGRRMPGTESTPATRPLWSPSIWAVVILVYTCVLVAPFWSPFDFTDDRATIRAAMDGFFMAPLARLIHGSTLSTISTVLHRLLWFAPLGALFAAWARSFRVSRPMRRVLWGVGLCGVSVVALTLELGQLTLPSRVADMSDVGLAIVGGALGLALAAWLLPSHNM